MAYNSHACCLYGPSLTSNLQSLQRAQIDVIWLSEGEVSSHTGGRNKRKAAPPHRSAVSLLWSPAIVREGGWISLRFQTMPYFGPPMKLPKLQPQEYADSHRARGRKRESHKTVVKEGRKERGRSVSCVLQEEGGIPTPKMQTTTKQQRRQM